MKAVLIENLDAVGAAENDADTHAEALRHVGWNVFTAVVGQAPAAADALLPSARGRVTRITRDASGRSALREFVSSVKPDAIFLAAGERGGGAIADALPSGAPAWWWPTAFLAGDVRGGTLESLDASAAEDPTRWALGMIPRSGRGLLPLWDGDFIVSPGPLSGAAGLAALEAFADLDDAWSGVDFVVLAHPQPEFEAQARELGVGPRVHFAGPAPREAEHAWLHTTAAVVIAGDAPLSGGVLLRALASGAPTVPIGPNGVPAGVRRWLERMDVAPIGAFHDGGVSALSAALERTESVERSRARGRSTAVAFDASALGASLGATRAAHTRSRAA